MATVSEIRSAMEMMEYGKDLSNQSKEMIFENQRRECIDPEKLYNFCEACAIDGKSITDVYTYDEIYERVALPGADKKIEELMDDREDLISAKKLWLDEAIKDTEEQIKNDTQLENVEKEATSELKARSEYVCTKEWDDKRVQWMEDLKIELEDPDLTTIKRNSIRRKIYVLENRFSMDFATYPISGREDPSRKSHFTKEKMKKKLVDIFFDSNRSKYMMDRFKSSCKRFGLSEDSYKYVMNIEEMFLEEKYHPFNNFFLQLVIYHNSYCYESEELEAKTGIFNLLNLVYHRFYSKEVEDIFLNAIRSFLDEFMEYSEMFKEKNYLYPKHPYRIELNAKREKDLRDKIRSDIREKEELPSGFDEMSLEDLIAYYNTRREVWESDNAKDDRMEDDVAEPAENSDNIEEGDIDEEN